MALFIIKPWYRRTEPPIVVDKIYGVLWGGTSSSALTRTDDAVGLADPVAAVNNGNGSSPFDTIMPWSGMRRVEDADAGTLVEIPKFYYKLDIDDTTGEFSLKISMHQYSGYSVSPAHADRGDGVGERDYVYVGAYHCSSTFKSKTGEAPLRSQTITACRSGIHNLGTGIWQWDKAMLETIQMLYLVEYADWNVQIKIGAGCSETGQFANTGMTDAMTYHTGTTAAAHNTWGFTRYRYIEGLWDNVYNLLDGFGIDNGNIMIIRNPSDYSDPSKAVRIGTLNGALLEGNIKRFKQSSVAGFEWVYYPEEVSGDTAADYTTYMCDRIRIRSTHQYVCVGGVANSATVTVGLFFMYGIYAQSADTSIGARLQKLP